MHNFGVMAQVLLTGENRFLSPRDFKELGVAKRSRSTTSARSALQQPWSIIGRTNFLKAATNLNLCRCSLPHLVRVRSVRDHHTRRQSHTASMDEVACSEFMFWRSCLRLPHSRLGYPRSGLSRSDLVRCPWLCPKETFQHPGSLCHPERIFGDCQRRQALGCRPALAVSSGTSVDDLEADCKWHA